MSSISGFSPGSYKSGVLCPFTVTGTGLPSPAAVGLNETTLGGVGWNVSAASISTSAGGKTLTFHATPTCSGSVGPGNLTLNLSSLVTPTMMFHSQRSSYS